MSDFTIPHRDPATPDEAAENGLALLEWNGISRERVRFLVAADLDTFDMSNTCSCVIGRTVGWRDHDELLIGFADADRFMIDADHIFGFDAATNEWDYDELGRAWRDLLGLPLAGGDS